MESYSDITTSFCFLVLPFLFLIIPFLIIFMITKIRRPLLNSIILFLICWLLEFIWWYVAFVIADYGNMTEQLYSIPNIFLIVAIIFHLELLKVKSPLIASSVLSLLCGFFRGFGIWMLFCEVEGPIRADNVLMAIYYSSFVGIFGAAVYCVVNFILHCPYRIFRRVRR